jgi:DNA-binding XRE family transcriptional regulator
MGPRVNVGDVMLSRPRNRAGCPGGWADRRRIGYDRAAGNGPAQHGKRQQARGAKPLDFCYRCGDSMSPKKLKTLLRELRERQSMSQLQLAKRADVTQGYISDLEAGTKKNPSVAILKKLARALGVPVGALLE